METRGTSRASGAEMNDSNFRMIDVGAKTETRRKAVAQGRIRMARETLLRIRDKTVPKGDVLALSEVAGIMAAKRTADILPLCHPLGLDAVKVTCSIEEAENAVFVTCEASTTAKTGVEMEALTGVSAALLCIYDLTKIIDPVLTISDILLQTKEGGKSGYWFNPKLDSQALSKSTESATPKVLEGLRAAVLTISDRCSRGEAEDRSGPQLAQALVSLGAQVEGQEILPDGSEKIAEQVRFFALEKKFDLVLLTGGTGLSPRDLTPEVLQNVWTKKIPGIGELLRARGGSLKPMAWLSRSEGGLVGQTLVILLPGSVKAVAEGMDALKDILAHAVHIAKGGAH